MTIYSIIEKDYYKIINSSDTKLTQLTIAIHTQLMIDRREVNNAT